MYYLHYIIINYKGWNFFGGKTKTEDPLQGCHFVWRHYPFINRRCSISGGVTREGGCVC